MLMDRMVKAADRTGVRWKHILTEVEAEPADIPTARAKMLLFRNAADKLSSRAGRSPVRIFRIPVRYRQPVLNLDHLATARQHEVAEWLLYAPRQLEGEITEAAGTVTMSTALSRELLHTLLIDSYAHAFDYSPDYRAYCQAMFDEYATELVNPLVLQENPRVISAVAPQQ